jgi:signal peptidase I
VAAAVGAVVALGTWPPFATVMSASMSPSIETGDVVVLKTLDRAPRTGEVVAVSVPDDARRRYGYPTVVVHRVTKVDPSGRITTKGDARPRVDPFTVSRAAVRGRVVLTVPAAGQIIAFMTSPMGLLWLAAGAVLLIGLPLLERQRAARDEERDTLAALHDELRTMSAEMAALRQQAEAPAPVTPAPVTPAPVAPAPVEVDEQPFDFHVDWRVLEDGAALPDAPDPAPAPVVRRRSGGLVGAVERYARSQRYN